MQHMATFNAFLREANGLRLIVIIYQAKPARFDQTVGDRELEECERIAFDSANLHNAHMLGIVELR